MRTADGGDAARVQTYGQDLARAGRSDADRITRSSDSAGEPKREGTEGFVLASRRWGDHNASNLAASS
jgi:hypothetical protein